MIDVLTEEVMPDGVTDDFRNRLVVESAGLDSEVWRWKPIPPDEWIMGEHYLNLKNTVRKIVFQDTMEFLESIDNDPWHRKYDEAVFNEGIGSGKSFKTSIIATYFEHLLLCLRCPQEYLEAGDKTSKLAIINMSISEKNARKVVFSEIMAKINSCQWFLERPWERDDARMPDPNCVSELRFKNNTFIIPGSSNWRTAVGYNIVIGIMDEAGSYRKTDNSDQAQDIYYALQRRLGSRVEEKGVIVIAGSPLYEEDFLELKVKEADEPESRVYGKRRSLWESKYPDWMGENFYVDVVNRMILETKPDNLEGYEVIPRIPFLFKAFKANVSKALRDFGAKPSATINSFFENPKMVLEMVNRKRMQDPIDKLGKFKEWFKPVSKALHAVHIDLALTGNAAGFALGHYDGLTNEGSIKTYIDLLIRIKGSKESPIQISKFREYIYALKQMGFNIGIITYDGFESSDSIQILEKKGFTCEKLSTDKTTIPYQDTKEAICEGRLDYYYVRSGEAENPSPSEVAIKELMRLEDIEGKKIDHPPKGSKDVADAIAGVVHNIITKGKGGGKVRAKIL